jgi:hypothetical protein
MPDDWNPDLMVKLYDEGYANKLAAVGELTRLGIGLQSSDDLPVGYLSVFPYAIELALDGSAHGAIVLLVHWKAFSETELASMVRQCTEDIENRMVPRRQAMRLTSTLTQANIDESNQGHFIADAKFFEAAMCDRFGFRVQRTRNARTILPRTITRNATDAGKQP